MSLQNNMQKHYSVLLKETISLLPQDANLLIDCTLGAGGHSLLALQTNPNLHVIGLDADIFMLGIAKERLKDYQNRTTFCNTWFNDFLADYPNSLADCNENNITNTNNITTITKNCAILMDLGLSMIHYKTEGRGFSIKDDTSLDMRLNPSSDLSALDIVNNYSEDDLTNMFFKLSEEKKSRQIARAIIRERKIKPINNATHLADIIRGCFGGKPSKSHPATRVFQALRIAVNNELERLEEALESAWSILEPESRLLVISFHSIEDRIVKQFMADKSKACRCDSSVLKCNCSGALGKLINKGGTIASDVELEENPASRSARLRVIEKIK